jgi:hypothetical protein
MDKAKADRDKPVTPVEYIPVISDVGSDSNMVCPDTMYGLLPKGTGKITLHESKPAPVQPVALDVTIDDDDALAYLRDMVVQSDGDLTPIRLIVGDGHSGRGLYVFSADYPDEGGVKIADVATTPPAAKRQWVGLTPEKIDELMYRFTGYELLYAIQAELKENNA